MMQKQAEADLGGLRRKTALSSTLVQHPAAVLLADVLGVGYE